MTLDDALALLDGKCQTVLACMFGPFVVQVTVVQVIVPLNASKQYFLLAHNKAISACALVLLTCQVSIMDLNLSPPLT